MSQKYGLDADLQAKAIAKYSKDDEAKAKAWIEEVTGEKMVSFMEGLKTGVILCKLANAIMPGSVGKFAPNPKHYLDFKGNISLYCAACVKMGLPSQDMITPIDLSDTRSDPSQVLSHIFAVARQSQAIGFRGPSLGVTYYKSREEQIALEQKRNREREEERRKKEEYDRMLLEKRDVAIAKKQARQTVKIEQNSDRRKRRIEERESRGRKSLREAPGVSDVAQRSPSPVLYGMDAEHAERIEAALLDWIEEITGYAMNGFVENLRTGVVLCELINKIRPGMIRQINIKIGRKSSALGERENIKKFLDACVGLGIPPGDLFLPQDLYDQKNLLQVQHGLWTLATHCATSLHHTNLPKVVDPYGSGFSSRYPKTPRPDKQGGVCYPKVASPAPTGYSAVFLVLFALFISFFAGFGNITGNTSIQYFVNLCNSTLNDTQTCHENPHFFELTNGAEFLAFFVSGLLLSFTGPKAVVSTGLALKMIGCILLGFAYLMPILWETGLSLVAAGGPFVLIGLFTLSDFHPHKFSLSNFSLVSAFITGSLVLSLLSTHLEANNLHNIVMWALGGIYFLSFLMSLYVVPFFRYQPLYEVLGDEDDEEDSDAETPTCSFDKVVIFIFAITFLSKTALQMTTEFSLAATSDPKYYLGIITLASLIVLFLPSCGFIIDRYSITSHILLSFLILLSLVSSLGWFTENNLTLVVFSNILLIISYSLFIGLWFTFLGSDRTKVGFMIAFPCLVVGLFVLPGLYFLEMFIHGDDISFWLHIGFVCGVGLFFFFPVARFCFAFNK